MMPRGALQRFARRVTAASVAAAEKCDLCSEPVRPEHRHLLESATRQVACVCQACGILFDRPVASNGKYRLIPNRSLHLADFSISDAEWDSLRVPVGICFIVVTEDSRPLAFYPGPMGATEAIVEPATWSALCRRYAVLATMQADVEALLVNRARGAREHFLVPIDTCFSLVGLIRTHWRGLSGGTSVWAAIEGFFETLRARSRVQRMEVTQCQSATT